MRRLDPVLREPRLIWHRAGMRRRFWRQVLIHSGKRQSNPGLAGFCLNGRKWGCELNTAYLSMRDQSFQEYYRVTEGCI